MDQILFALIFAFFITLFTIPKIIYVSEKNKLYDNPDKLRKFHSKPISSLGGAGIFFGFIVTLLLSANFSIVGEFQYYLVCFILIFFIGIKDDLAGLSAFKKFIGQALIACILMFKAHLLITNMHGFLGMTQIHISVSYFLTFFTFIVIINAFNLIDGVDGLAASLGLVISIVFGGFFLFNQNIAYALMGFGFAGSLAAFLIYNFQPAKIFMGDTGSLLMGVVNSILVIKFIETSFDNTPFAVSAIPAIAFSILLIPLMDTLRVFAIRISNRRSPFSGDRNHIHHLLFDRGMSHKSIALFCTAANILIILATISFQAIGTTWLISGLAGGFFLMIYGIKKVPVKVSMRIIKRNVEASLNTKDDGFAQAGSI